MCYLGSLVVLKLVWSLLMLRCKYSLVLRPTHTLMKRVGLGTLESVDARNVIDCSLSELNGMNLGSAGMQAVLGLWTKRRLLSLSLDLRQISSQCCPVRTVACLVAVNVWWQRSLLLDGSEWISWCPGANVPARHCESDSSLDSVTTHPQAHHQTPLQVPLGKHKRFNP